MLIVCPTCATSYMIEPASLGAGGRMVRCARCKASWFAGGPEAAMAGFAADVIAEAEAREAPVATKRSTTSADDFGSEPAQPAAAIADAPAAETPPPQLEADEAPPIVPPIVEPPAAGTAPGDIETFMARRARMHVRRKKRQRSSKWTAIILVLLSFNVTLVLARTEVVRYLPQTAALFEAVGLKVNLRQLSFEGVKISSEQRDGVPVLTVEGTIASKSDSPVEVPRMRFAVRNVTGQEIYAWTSKPARSILEPGEKLPFRSRLASPPADASDVLVRFVNADDAPAAGK